MPLLSRASLRLRGPRCHGGVFVLQQAKPVIEWQAIALVWRAAESRDALGWLLQTAHAQCRHLSTRSGPHAWAAVRCSTRPSAAAA
jgi:hypothetical protein